MGPGHRPGRHRRPQKPRATRSPISIAPCPAASSGGASSASISPTTAQTFAALHGHDAVIQLAANGEPDWDHVSGAARFHVNTLIAYNVFQAACFLEHEEGRVGVVGNGARLSLSRVPPTVLPTNDDDPPIPTGVLRHQQGRHRGPRAAHEPALRRAVRRPALLQHLLRHSPATRRATSSIPKFWDDPQLAQVQSMGLCRQPRHGRCLRAGARESDITGAEVMTIAAADTIMRQTNAELVAACLPRLHAAPGHRRARHADLDRHGTTADRLRAEMDVAAGAGGELRSVQAARPLIRPSGTSSP